MDDNDRRYEWCAWLLWALSIIAISCLVIQNPLSHSVVSVYHDASDNWWTRDAIYNGSKGMNYLPQFTILFSPFHALGTPAGDILWRVVSTLCLAWAIRRLIVIVSPQPVSRDFLWGSCFALPVCLGAMRNGQANALFAAVTVLAVVLLMERRWKMAGAALVLAIAIKPLGIVLALLAVFGYRRVILPLVVCTGLLVLLPFAFGPMEYVLAQYAGLVENLRTCSQAGVTRRFANLNGLLQELSIELPGRSISIMSLMGGFGTWVIWLIAGRRLDEPERGLLLVSLATVYLMLFNPMNESNSFVIIAPAIIAVAVRLRQVSNSQIWAWSLASLLLSTWVLPELLRSLDRDSQTWWKPVAAITFIGIVMARTHALVRTNPRIALSHES